MTLLLWCSLLAATQSAASLPREMRLEEARPQDPAQEKYPPQEPQPPAAKSRPFVDLDWLELTPGVGFAVFSSKYRTDPAPGGALFAHAPMPWCSPSYDPGGEYVGLFAEVAFTTIDRDLSSSVDHRSGVASFYSLGVDYSLLREGTWILVARGGLLYAYYGDIADLKSGVGFTLGASAGIQISGKLGLTYTPTFYFGTSGSLVLLNTLGLTIQF